MPRAPALFQTRSALCIAAGAAIPAEPPRSAPRRQTLKTTTHHQGGITLSTNPHKREPPRSNRGRGFGAAVTVIRFTRVVGGMEFREGSLSSCLDCLYER